MKKKPDKLPEPKENLSGLKKWAMQAENPRKDETFKQEPFLQHQLSTESKSKGIKMKMLHQHPLNPDVDETNTPLISNPLKLPDELAARLSWYLNAVRTQPTMANRSNLDAPTPFRPRGKGQQ
jgi:hypothetical protein